MRRTLPYLLSLPALLVCIGILIPFFTAAYYSMMRFRLNLPMLKGFIWFDNYIAFAQRRHVLAHGRRFARSMPALTVGLELMLGLGIALLLQKPTRFNNAASILLLLPLMTAPALAALMWKLMTNPNFGILSYLVSLARHHRFQMGVGPGLGARSRSCSWTSGSTRPSSMILLLAGLRSLPKQPFEAAALDGVPRSFVFFRITLPMLMPYIITATLFRLLDSIQQFDIIYPMTQGGPGDTLLVFQVRSYLEFFQYTNVGKSAAILMVLWAITYFLSNIFIKHWLKLRERTRGHG